MVVTIWGPYYYYLAFLRPLLLITKVKDLRHVFTTIFKTLPRTANVTVLFFTIVFIYAGVGRLLFRGLYTPEVSLAAGLNNGEWHCFDSMGQAVLALFVLSTTENYPSIMYPALRRYSANSVASAASAATVCTPRPHTLNTYCTPPCTPNAYFTPLPQALREQCARLGGDPLLRVLPRYSATSANACTHSSHTLGGDPLLRVLPSHRSLPAHAPPPLGHVRRVERAASCGLHQGISATSANVCTHSSHTLLSHTPLTHSSHSLVSPPSRIECAPTKP
jgi:hypothetical protein